MWNVLPFFFFIFWTRTWINGPLSRCCLNCLFQFWNLYYYYFKMCVCTHHSSTSSIITSIFLYFSTCVCHFSRFYCERMLKYAHNACEMALNPRAILTPELLHQSLCVRSYRHCFTYKCYIVIVELNIFPLFGFNSTGVFVWISDEINGKYLYFSSHSTFF